MSFKVKKVRGKYKISLLTSPLPRVLKFETIKSLLNDVKGETILDYGSGNSPYKEFMLTKYQKYLSADYLPANTLYKDIRPQYYINKDQSVNLPTSSVDCVLITEVLEHIYSPLDALQEINRVLKSNGHIIGSVPFALKEHEAPFDYFRYTSFCLERLLEESGFTNIQVIKIGDEIGISLRNLSFPFKLLEKMLTKARLKYIGLVFKLIGNIPLYFYYIVIRKKKSLEKFATYPFGFVFYAEKRIKTQD